MHACHALTLPLLLQPGHLRLLLRSLTQGLQVHCQQHHALLLAEGLPEWTNTIHPLLRSEQLLRLFPLLRSERSCGVGRPRGDECRPPPMRPASGLPGSILLNRTCCLGLVLLPGFGLPPPPLLPLPPFLFAIGELSGGPGYHDVIFREHTALHPCFLRSGCGGGGPEG